MRGDWKWGVRPQAGGVLRLFQESWWASKGPTQDYSRDNRWKRAGQGRRWSGTACGCWSVNQFSWSLVSDSLQPHGLQHARPPCPPPTPGVYSNSCPSSRWCHPTTSPSVVLFSCLQSFPASGFFQWVSSSHQVAKVLVSASASVLPMNIQNWSPLGWTGWISLQSKGLSRVFSNTTVQSHQFFGAQHSLWSNSHIHTWLLQKP